MSLTRTKGLMLSAAAGAILAIIGLSEPVPLAAKARHASGVPLPVAQATCAQGVEESGLETYLASVVSDASPRGSLARGMWKLPAASPSVVTRVLVDSVCAQAIAGFNTHLDSASAPIANAFVYQVDTLYVVEPIAAPAGKHFKLIMVLTKAWQHVASIAA
jgi:hypothetical protein